MADFTIAQMYDQYDRVTEGKNRITYGYHVDGQLATVTKGKTTEEFTWDGLALVKRGTISYVNEPHPGGGAPVASSNSGVMFNDILGTTLGVSANDGYASSSMTAFGDTINCQLPTTTFFTGKPHVDGLGHAFLLRNYRADLGKWPTADPLGYPDGWNQLAYCGNEVVDCLDFLGAVTINYNVRWTNFEFQNYYHASSGDRIFGDMFDTDCMQLTDAIWAVIADVVLPRVENQIDNKVRRLIISSSSNSGSGSTTYVTSNSYNFISACWALGDGTVSTRSIISYSWWDVWQDDIRMIYYVWTASVSVNYSDVFKDPLDVGIEMPFSSAYSYFHIWENVSLVGAGTIE